MVASEGSSFLPTSRSVWVTVRGWDAATFSKVPESSERLSQAWGKARATQDEAGCECHAAGAPCRFPLCSNTLCHSRTGTHETHTRPSHTHSQTPSAWTHRCLSFQSHTLPRANIHAQPSCAGTQSPLHTHTLLGARPGLRTSPGSLSGAQTATCCRHTQHAHTPRAGPGLKGL